MSENPEKQRRAEAEVESFRENLGPFVVAAETTRMPMVFASAKAADTPIIFANDSFLALTGYTREEVLGQSFNFLMARGTEPEVFAQVKAAFESPIDDLEIHYRRKDGTEFWATLFISPVKDKNGDIIQYFASFVDETRHIKEHNRSKMLVNELNHRVKNTLATVVSIASQAFRNSSNPAVIKKSIEARLFALSRSHDLLTHEKWEGANLHDVVKAAMEPFGVADGRAERFIIRGENIRFRPNAALILGIALNELATNAVKYGAFSNEVGSIVITWTVEQRPEGDRLLLLWQEKDGPPVTPPTRRGFGSRVIERGLAHELEGRVKLEYPATGVVCTIDIPLTSLKIMAK